MIRSVVYATLVFVGLFLIHAKLNLQKEIQSKEYWYLFRSVEAKIRIHHVNTRILDKQILQLRKALGKWNSELNPYEE